MEVSLIPAYAAEAHDIPAGRALAETLRRIADHIESNINILPYPANEEWIDETHTVIQSGSTLGVYHLNAIPSDTPLPRIT